MPAFLLLFLGGVFGGAFVLFNLPGPHSEKAVFIPPGSSLRAATNILESEGVIEPAETFFWISRLQGAADKIRAGEYLVPTAASQSEILDILIRGEVLLHSITLPEGLSSKQIVDLLNASLVLAGEISEIPPEGTLLPETYMVPRGTQKESLLRDMRQGQQALLDELWGNYTGTLAFDTVGEAVTLASIVEEETAIPEERRMIAAVFINRLKAGMRLQSDPTVIYGITQGYPLGRPLRQSELNADTPYNTYVHYGLPPGPISNPGRAALEAVFNPAETSALYFVADGSGGHVFADTLEEHNENVQKWRKFEKESRGN